jgi:(p)ppGpp synthase/HD superfamily hydrolase
VRKREAVAHLRDASTEAVAVKLADTLHNAQSILLDLRLEGPGVWERFNREPHATVRYYERVLEVGRKRLPDHPLVYELTGTLAQLRSVAAGTS